MRRLWLERIGILSCIVMVGSVVVAANRAEDVKSAAVSGPTEAAPELPAQILEAMKEAVSEAAAQSPDAFAIPWQSVNGGGSPSSSASYSINSTVGQGAIGYSSSASYGIGAGYWYGAEAGTPPSCVCDCHADPQCDGVTNVLDVVNCVNVAFKGGAAIPDPNGACPYETTDVDCNTVTNVLDVVKLVNVAFKGQSAAANFCDPCP